MTEDTMTQSHEFQELFLCHNVLKIVQNHILALDKFENLIAEHMAAAADIRIDILRACVYYH
ncbi:hypothetical protein N7457_002857 [Penicillium paradoxum]|uniref:uncharacterized protein n=1 Tax=Penicillium paradoxum TaxID=176176 RepID=UPI002548C955|nr:uncharacterized protein N7457_002857 [Penicillium paradoxum]KAJ5787867.1 hypothetical protein N7457_002857 [Penicillium paradoxum]